MLKPTMTESDYGISGNDDRQSSFPGVTTKWDSQVGIGTSICRWNRCLNVIP